MLLKAFLGIHNLLVQLIPFFVDTLLRNNGSHLLVCINHYKQSSYHVSQLPFQLTVYLHVSRDERILEKVQLGLNIRKFVNKHL